MFSTVQQTKRTETSRKFQLLLSQQDEKKSEAIEAVYSAISFGIIAETCELINLAIKQV